MERHEKRGRTLRQSTGRAEDCAQPSHDRRRRSCGFTAAGSHIHLSCHYGHGNMSGSPVSAVAGVDLFFCSGSAVGGATNFVVDAEQRSAAREFCRLARGIVFGWKQFFLVLDNEHGAFHPATSHRGFVAGPQTRRSAIATLVLCTFHLMFHYSQSCQARALEMGWTKGDAVLVCGFRSLDGVIVGAALA